MYYILYGDDQSRIQKKLKSIETTQKADTIHYYDALNDTQEIVLEDMDSLSIFEDRKMIVIKNCSFLSAKNKTNYDINEFLLRRNEDLCVIVFIHEGNKLDQRKKNVKELVATSKVLSCMTLDQESQLSYIRETLKKNKVSMDPDALRWFCQRIGYDVLRIDSEVYKLKTYADHITLNDVKALIAPVPVDDVFKMVDALFQKNKILLLAFYRNFRKQNMEPVAIIGLLASQLRFLFQVRIYMDQGYSSDTIASILKAHPYRVSLNVKKARSFSSEELLDQLESLANLDQNMKLGLVNKDEGFERFILEL